MSFTKLKFRQLRLNSTDFAEDSTTGEIQIKNLAITTAKIRAAAVTTSKLADGAVETGKIANLNITTEKIAGGAVTTAKIADGNVTTSKIGNSQVTTAKINDAAVTTAKILDANVTTDKIANLNVTTGKIADDAITTAKIADSAVTTAKIQDGAVTTAKIADSAVTSAKINNLAVTTGKLADGAVESAKIANLNVTEAKLGAQSVSNSKIADSTIALGKFANQANNQVFMADSSGNVIVSFIGNDNLSSGLYPSITGLGAQAQDLNMNGNKVVGMQDPSDAQDGATKAYVDGVSDSLYWKAPVALASDTGETINLANVSASLTLDNVSVADGDRVLLKDQTTASQNGIYVYDSTAAANARLVRTSDANTVNATRNEVNGAAVFVLKGAENADKGFVQTAEVATLGSDSLTWVQFSGLGQYSAGAGIAIDPSTGVISISQLVASQIKSRRQNISDSLSATDETNIGHAGNGLLFGSSTSYDAGMVAASAQVYLNGTLLRPATALNKIFGNAGADGDYFIREDTTNAGQSQGKINVASGLVQEGDRLEVRFIGA